MSQIINHSEWCVLSNHPMVSETTTAWIVSIKVTRVAPIHVNLNLSGTRVIMSSTMFRCFQTLSKSKLDTNPILWLTLVEMDSQVWDRIVQTGATQGALALVSDRRQTLPLQTLLMLTTGSSPQVNRMAAPRHYLMAASAHATITCVALSIALDPDQVNQEPLKPAAGLTTRSSNLQPTVYDL
jgi:hypothetical protein